MRPLAKSGLTWLAVIVALCVFFAGRYVWVQGLLNNPAPVASGICRDVAVGLKDPADIAVDAGHDALFIAALNRQATPEFSDKGDGIYLLKLSDPSQAPVRLAGVPPDFHPSAITLFLAEDGAETLIVADRRTTGRNLIESYDLTFDGNTPKLAPHSAIQGGLLVSPNGLAAAAADHFYVSNDHTTRNPWGRFAEQYLLWPHADVMAYNGTGFRIAAQRLTAPAGLLIRNDILYAATANSVQAFSQDFLGFLTPLGQLGLPARPNRISQDGHGNLIVTGQAKPGSSQVYRVVLDAQGVPQSYQTIFSDDGRILKGASAALFAGNQLFIAASGDSKMLVCSTK